MQSFARMAASIVVLISALGSSASAQYLPARHIGIISALHDYWCDPTKYCGDGNYADAQQIGNLSVLAGEPLGIGTPAQRGFRAIKLWPHKYGYLSTDMMNIYNFYLNGFCIKTSPPQCWDSSEFDVIVIRPLQNSTTVLETGCDGKSYRYFRWENIDYGQVATGLYQAIGHLNKIIILTGWEADNQIKGLGCPNRIPTPAEEQALIDLLDARQQGVAAARNANLGKNLRIYHAVEVSHVLSYNYRVIDSIVPRLTYQPDFISFSAWTTDLASVSMTAALDHIRLRSGLPRNRIFIGEYGAKEGPSNNPYAKIFDRFQDAFDWGVRLGFYWNFRDHFTCPKEKGTWIRRCDESLSKNYYPLRDLRNLYDE